MGGRTVRSDAAAQRYMAKPPERTWPAERDAIRRWLAGDLPAAGGAGKHLRSIEAQVVEAVRRAQAAGATLRDAWHDAGKEERARRVTREGGKEGALWRGIGWEAWLQNHHAATVSSTQHGARDGWTIAAALIWYKTRQRTRATRKATQHPHVTHAVPDAHGNGVVIFDTETTQPITADVALRDMEVSVACALWVPQSEREADAWARAERGTFWNAAVTRTPTGDAARPVASLLAWFDEARVIAAYNGHGFDMEVLWAAYRGDRDRWERHRAKLHDPLHAITNAAGRRASLAQLLKWNGLAAKDGVGAEAPRLWEDGRLARLEQYCERDTHALAELLMKSAVRVQTHKECREASLRAQIVRSGHEASHRGANEPGGDGDTGGASSSDCGVSTNTHRNACHTDNGGGSADDADSPAQKRRRQGDEELLPLQATQDNDCTETVEAAACTLPTAQRTNKRQHDSVDNDTEDAMHTNSGRQRRWRNASDATSAAPQAMDGSTIIFARDDEIEPDSQTAPDRQTDADRRTDEPTRTAQGGPPGTTPRRPKRANTQTPSSYDETTRRGPKRARTAYMMRGEGRGEKRTAIELGVRVVDRIVDGAYEWRDAGLPALTPRGRQTDGQA